MEQTAFEMQNRAEQFRLQYGEYFRDRVSEKELTEQTTQPFWQSLRLSRRRLEEKGLSLDISLYNDVRKPADPDGRVKPEKDGWNNTGISSKAVRTDRKFRKGGKIIYRQREQEISNVSLLKSNVQGDDAHCPNCGHVGKISSFIDGCDYCDSKFLVSDFETKVSGFALEENQYKTVKRIFNKTFLAAVLMFVALFVVMVASFVVAFGLMAVGVNNQTVVMSAAILAYALTNFSFYGKILFWAFGLYVTGRLVILLLYHRVIVGEEVVKALIPDFSAYDFYQNLEYKLRNIHLTDSAAEVQPFAAFDLSEVVARYGNVVDCAMTGLRFLSVREDTGSDGYIVAAEARVKLTLFQKEKIKIRYERLKLELSGTKEMLRHNCNAIREYKCETCGASVNILEGGVCAHCGNKLDYGRYGWMLQRYACDKKFVNVRRQVQVAVFVLFALIVALNMVRFFGKTGGNTVSWGQIFQLLTHTEEIMDSYYGKVPLPGDAGLSLTLISEETRELYLNRTWIYEAEDVQAAYRTYVEYLTQERQCAGSVAYTEPPKAELYLPIPVTGDIIESYHLDDGLVDLSMDLDWSAQAIIRVTVEEGRLIIEVELTDI